MLTIDSNIASMATDKLTIYTGLTGNIYAFSKQKYVVTSFCGLIKKARTSVFYSGKYGVYFVRMKSKYHKQRVEMYQNGILQHATDF